MNNDNPTEETPRFTWDEQNSEVLTLAIQLCRAAYKGEGALAELHAKIESARMASRPWSKSSRGFWKRSLT
jgi:hypothetical protein